MARVTDLPGTRHTPTVAPLALDLAALVRLSAQIAAGSEPEIRAACQAALDADVPTPWVEECILQSYLMAGFPRALGGLGPSEARSDDDQAVSHVPSLRVGRPSDPSFSRRRLYSQ